MTHSFQSSSIFALVTLLACAPGCALGAKGPASKVAPQAPQEIVPQPPGDASDDVRPMAPRSPPPKALASIANESLAHAL